MSVWTCISEFLVPRRCALCGTGLLYGEQGLCNVCLGNLPRTGWHSDPNPMEQRFVGYVKFRRATGIYLYQRDSSIAAVIQKFKYDGCHRLAWEMGRVMGEKLEMQGWLCDVDVVFPVPMHWSKLMRRGYNQTLQLAEGLRYATGITVGKDLVARHGHSTQTGMGRDQRLVNTSKVFDFKHPERYAGKHVVILDDVCTTGATLVSAARCIKALAPEAEVSMLTLAVTV